MLSQQHGRPQIRVELPVPVSHVQGCDAIIEKERGIVDETGDGTQTSHHFVDETTDVHGIGEVCWKRLGCATVLANFGDDGVSLAARRAVVNGHAPSPPTEIEGNGATDAATRTGHECAFRSGAGWAHAHFPST